MHERAVVDLYSGGALDMVSKTSGLPVTRAQSQEASLKRL
jgi:hypothetical protein